MPAFEWVHVQLHQQKGMISLSPPTICNSALSTTSPQSHITYVNPDFIKISGFTEEELLGQPHNIVRHPDMPPAAFEHMWSTLKSGRSWMGLVKNRCKNGDHYWVSAYPFDLSLQASGRAEAASVQNTALSPHPCGLPRPSGNVSAILRPSAPAVSATMVNKLTAGRTNRMPGKA
ncbi:PAS domain-containing protein [Klebsiella pneumoniae]|uniref:PAS domain-containing protein n=1 Tax=Klebsiella pneumoniae TaxID=573 RepID=UPI003A8116B6